MSDPFIGKQLGDYVIQELLGRGGMARVYKGYDERLQRYAAVKVINSELAGTADQAEYAERFRREARAIARLHHPNIVGVYQFGEYESNYYMAMVFIEGKDLREILKERAEGGTYLPQADALNIVRGIGGALDYAHTRGVIHRDIKPSNIMLDSENRAVLTDFGLALSTQEGTLGDTFGSAHYIAPEQAVSSAKAVPQSDLYSLGVVMYEMLAGKVPFDDPSAMSVALKHLNDAPPPPTMFNPALTPSIEKVLLKILDKDPNRRYPTGEQLANALEAAIAGKYEAPVPVVQASTAPVAVDARQVALQAHENRLAELTGAAGAKATPAPQAAEPKVSDPAKMTPLRTPSGEDAISTMLPIPAADPNMSTQEMQRPVAPTESKAGRGLLFYVPIVVVILLLAALGVYILNPARGTTQAANASSTPALVGEGTLGAVLSGTEAATESVAGSENTPGSEVASPSAPGETTTPGEGNTPEANASATGEGSTPAGQGAGTTQQTAAATTAATSANLTSTGPATEGGTQSPSGTAARTMLTLTYDDTQFILTNTSGKILDIHKLTFIQHGDSPATNREMDTSLWSASGSQYQPYELPSRFCYQVYRNDRNEPTPIPECAILPINFRAAWAKVAEPRRFWIAANSNVTTFDVEWDGTVITTCAISAGRCDVNLPKSAGQ
ncbi:MAG TPA: protein kinase [Aggregatilineales bacterium]|nr:protein kinase [Aggregatilineales bacterium]